MICPRCKKPYIVLTDPYTNKEVWVQACIAKTIEALWEAEYELIDFNCNEKVSWPSLIIPERYDKNVINAMIKIIKQNDQRPYNIYSMRNGKITEVAIHCVTTIQVDNE